MWRKWPEEGEDESEGQFVAVVWAVGAVGGGAAALVWHYWWVENTTWWPGALTPLVGILVGLAGAWIAGNSRPVRNGLGLIAGIVVSVLRWL